MKTTNFFSVLLILSAILFAPVNLSSQVTIGSGEPPRATLDVVNPNDGNHAGIIFPNVSRAQLNALAYTADQTGVIVYVYALGGTATGQVLNVTETGFYYFDGTAWQPLAGINTFPAISSSTGLQITGSATDTITIDLPVGTDAGQVLRWDAASSEWTPATPAASWQLGGNTATSSTNILGTTNTQPLRIRTGSGDIGTTERMRVATSGNVAIGTTNATHRLQIAGATAAHSSFTMWQNSGTAGAAAFPVLRMINAGTGTTLGEIIWGRTNTVNLAASSAWIRAYAPTPDSGALIFATRADGTTAERMRIHTNGFVGINTEAPTAALDVGGQIRIRGGNPGVGRVLTSNADGTATWENLDEVGYFRTVPANNTVYDLTITRGQVFLITISSSFDPNRTRTVQQIAGPMAQTNARLTTIFPVPSNIFLSEPAINNGNYITLPGSSMHIITCQGATRTLRFEGNAQMTIHQIH